MQDREGQGWVVGMKRKSDEGCRSVGVKPDCAGAVCVTHCVFHMTPLTWAHRERGD